MLLLESLAADWRGTPSALPFLAFCLAHAGAAFALAASMVPGLKRVTGRA